MGFSILRWGRAGVGREGGLPVVIVVEGRILGWGVGWVGSLDPSLRSG